MEKYTTAGQATDGRIIRRMRDACWVTKVETISMIIPPSILLGIRNVSDRSCRDFMFNIFFF